MDKKYWFLLRSWNDSTENFVSIFLPTISHEFLPKYIAFKLFHFQLTTLQEESLSRLIKWKFVLSNPKKYKWTE